MKWGILVEKIKIVWYNPFDCVVPPKLIWLKVGNTNTEEEYRKKPHLTMAHKNALKFFFKEFYNDGSKREKTALEQWLK